MKKHSKKNRQKRNFQRACLVLSCGLMITIITLLALRITVVDAAPEETYRMTSADAQVTMVSYTKEDVDDLAKVIYAKAGASWIPDEIQRYVGSVVLNRVKDDRYPDTIHDVVYEEGQYLPLEETPDLRARRNAVWLLENGSILPEDVIFQSNEIQGEVYYTYSDEILGDTYFCKG